MKIPMLDLRREYDYMKADIDAAIKRCLEHQQWILGPEVQAFEEAAAGYLGVRYCIGVCSGTDALVVALRALAIERTGKEYFTSDDKIITTPFTFTATGDAILRARATPVFIDIDPLTFNLDTRKIEDYLRSTSSKVVGIIPVHLYGQACNMDEIRAIAQKYNLFIVEDVAQAFGGEWRGQKLGSLGDLGAFSFFPSKNLGGFGDGGMVSTNDKDLVDLVRMLIKHGGKDKYNVDHIGYNARLDTLQGAILLAKLKYIDEFNSKRRAIADQYRQGLCGLKGLQIPHTTQEAFHVFHQYTVRACEGKRDLLQRYLKENGVDTMVYYPVLLNKMKVFSGRCEIFPSRMTVSEEVIREVLSIPIEPLMKEEELKYVCEKVRIFMS